MRKLVVITLLLCFFAEAADAQRRRRGRSSFNRAKKPYRYEIIGNLGATNFLGELGGANQIGTNGLKDLEKSMTRPALGVSARVKIAKFVSGKGNFWWGILRGDDKTTLEPFRNARNLNFRSGILELSGQIELNFLREQKGHVYQIKGVRGLRHKDKSMYLFVGGGGVYFNPKGQYLDGSWHALRPLSTEGQGIVPGKKKYAPVSPILALGGGMRFAINRYWGWGFEVGMRKTWTDYMDDVSTFYPDPAIFNGDPIATYLSNPNTACGCTGEIRGDSTDKDAYMFFTLNVGYKVVKRKRSRSKF